MKEVRIESFCDWCVKDGNIRTPSELTFHVVINTVVHQRPRTHVLDVCAAHYKSRILEFADLLEELPVSDMDDVPVPTLSTPPRFNRSAARGEIDPPKKETCEICGTTLNRGSLVQHIWNVHRPGETRPPQPDQCPECGAVMNKPRYMNTHRAQSHGWNPLEDAYAGVMSEGERARIQYDDHI